MPAAVAAAAEVAGAAAAAIASALTAGTTAQRMHCNTVPLVYICGAKVLKQ